MGNPAHRPTFSLKIAMCNHQNTAVGRNVSHDLAAAWVFCAAVLLKGITLCHKIGSSGLNLNSLGVIMGCSHSEYMTFRRRHSLYFFFCAAAGESGNCCHREIPQCVDTIITKKHGLIPSCRTLLAYLIVIVPCT